MVDPLTRDRAVHRLLYLAIAALILFLRLLPVNPAGHSFPGPDLMLAFTFAWLMRRPDYVPVLLIVAVYVVEDMVFWRPLGLWPLLMLLATEWLRTREESLRDLPFLLEFALIGGLWFAMVLARRLILALVFSESVPFGMELLRLLATLAAYPLVVALLQTGLGLRRAAPGEVDDFGQRR